MNDESLLNFRKDIQEVNLSLIDIVDRLEAKMVKPDDGIQLNNVDELVVMMKRKRKESGTSLEDLTLQTNLSLSTLKRLFDDPSGARFSNVILVLNELGIKSWAEK